VLAQLKATEGDTICVTDAADGSLRISRAKPEVTRQMKAAEKIARLYPLSRILRMMSLEGFCGHSL
jgi:hypothetical protein